jgi:hypothetical protein
MSHPAHRIILTVIALSWLSLITTPAVLAQKVIVPDQPTPTMPLEDIRVGMTGYGMTVFHGTKIEPFNVVVVSVMPNSSPTRSVIWIRCDDPRMVESGPVQGMSGSPIFLWDENEPHEIGKGGKLVGAFAFGYSQSKLCLVGVQPIEYMRESTTRAAAPNETSDANGRRGGSTRQVVELLDRLDQMPQLGDDSSLGRVRLRANREALIRASGGRDIKARKTTNTDTVTGPRSGAMASQLMLPISLGSTRTAEVFAPLLEPMGLLAVANNAAAVAGDPPHGIDPGATSIEPGSVLAIPLAFGDMDLSATGTVTDVLPGGEVMAFGHPMFGLGSSQVPMATGYVHFVMPRSSISFKSSGSLTLVGTLVRDESAGVVGLEETRYTTAPVDVTVNMPGQPASTYHYQVVNEPTLSPMLTASVILNSVETVYSVPVENTIRLRSEMHFTGGRVLTLDTLIAGGSAASPIFEMLTPLSIMAMNPYESLEVESVSVKIDVEEGNRMATLINARLERSEVSPGESVGVLLDIQHYAGRLEHRRIEVQIPDDLDEGDYPLSISGANTFAALKINSQPHLMTTRNIDDMAEFIQATMSFRSDAIYTAILLPPDGLAVGRTEMANLPSSRAAILSSPTTTETFPFVRLADQVFDADTVILGEVNFTLNVRKP